MLYLCLAITVVWGCHLGYLWFLDRQARQLRRRLEARQSADRSDADAAR